MILIDVIQVLCSDLLHNQNMLRNCFNKNLNEKLSKKRENRKVRKVINKGVIFDQKYLLCNYLN